VVETAVGTWERIGDRGHHHIIITTISIYTTPPLPQRHILSRQLRSTAAQQMKTKTPETHKPTSFTSSETVTTSPTGSDDSLVDPPGYIAPDQQDMMLTDITSAMLHSNECSITIGRGKEYLSPADSIQLPWPATGIIFGYNKRLMISLPCRRTRPGRGYGVLNVFFLVDTGSPCSYLSREAMEALINKPDCNLPEQLQVVIQNESFPMHFYMSPLGTQEHPGKFHDVNVLGMDFLIHNKLSMMVDTPISQFQLLQKDLQSIYANYPDED
jgi:hypothetical protein